MSIVVDPAHLEILNTVFSIQSFRDGQYAAIQATLARKDSLVILPTGAGKSLTFQFPPYAKGSAFIVVIGPLIALMKDQVEKCADRGLDAAVYNSECSEIQKQNILRDIVSDDPGIRLLYTTPESLQQPRLRDALKEAALQGTLLAFSIDEAHCISDWGTDFRPAYLGLSTLKADYPGIPIAALTASCTPAVQKSIASLLHLQDPVVIKTSFNRPNIRYIIRYSDLLGSPADVMEDLVALVKALPDQCGIIYARTRAECDTLAQTLSGYDLEVGCYHAGKDPQTRSRVQREWSEGALNIVIATVAFGMGIDRADVRWVVHWNAPGNLERFYQESGRGGRDGQPCLSIIYARSADMAAAQRMERSRQTDSTTMGVSDMAMTGCCRRKRLVEHFGEKRGPCGQVPGELACDHCANPAAVRRCLNALEHKEEQSSLAARVRLYNSMNNPQQPSSPGDTSHSDKQANNNDDTCEKENSNSVQSIPPKRFVSQSLVRQGGWWASASGKNNTIMNDEQTTVAPPLVSSETQQDVPIKAAADKSGSCGLLQLSWEQYLSTGPVVVTADITAAEQPQQPDVQVQPEPPKALAIPRLKKRKLHDVAIAVKVDTATSHEQMTSTAEDMAGKPVREDVSQLATVGDDCHVTGIIRPSPATQGYEQQQQQQASKSAMMMPRKAGLSGRQVFKPPQILRVMPNNKQ